LSEFGGVDGLGEQGAGCAIGEGLLFKFFDWASFARRILVSHDRLLSLVVDG
jgi:hypothetical protein